MFSERACAAVVVDWHLVALVRVRALQVCSRRARGSKQKSGKAERVLLGCLAARCGAPLLRCGALLFAVCRVELSRAHRAGCPLGRRRRREDTLGALDGLAGVGEDCVARSVPSRRGLAVARAAPSVPAILWLAAHPRRRLQTARFATRAATRTAKGSRRCAEGCRRTAGRAVRAAASGTRTSGSRDYSGPRARTARRPGEQAK